MAELTPWPTELRLDADTLERGLTDAVRDNDAQFPPDFRLSRSGRARPAESADGEVHQ